MAQKFLDMCDSNATFQQMGGETMSEGVKGHVFFNIGFFCGSFKKLTGTFCGIFTSLLTFKEINAGGIFFIVGSLHFCVAQQVMNFLFG